MVFYHSTLILISLALVFAQSSLCQPGFFAHDNGIFKVCKGIIYLACSEFCDPCNPDPQCFTCGQEILEVSPRIDNTIGYQVKFTNGTISINFAADVLNLSKKNFKVSSKNGKEFNTDSWSVTKESNKQYKIATNLKANDLPLDVEVIFGQY